MLIKIPTHDHTEPPAPCRVGNGIRIFDTVNTCKNGIIIFLGIPVIRAVMLVYRYYKKVLLNGYPKKSVIFYNGRFTGIPLETPTPVYFLTCPGNEEGKF